MSTEEKQDKPELSWNITPEMQRKRFKQARDKRWPKILAARYAGMEGLPNGKSFAEIPDQEYLPEAKKMLKDWQDRVRKGNFRYTVVDER